MRETGLCSKNVGTCSNICHVRHGKGGEGKTTEGRRSLKFWRTTLPGRLSIYQWYASRPAVCCSCLSKQSTGTMSVFRWAGSILRIECVVQTSRFSSCWPPPQRYGVASHAVLAHAIITCRWWILCAVDGRLGVT